MTRRRHLDRGALVERMFLKALVTARRYAGILPPCFDRDDIECAALEGLVMAAERFDPSLGFKFTTYAYRYIQGYMKRAASLQAMALFRGAITWDEAAAREYPDVYRGSLDDLPMSRMIEVLKADKTPTPEQEAVRKAASAHLWAVVDQLPQRMRENVYAYYREDRTCEDIALERGVSTQAISCSLRDASARLRAMLVKKQGTPAETEARP